MSAAETRQSESSICRIIVKTIKGDWFTLGVPCVERHAGSPLLLYNLSHHAKCIRLCAIHQIAHQSAISNFLCLACLAMLSANKHEARYEIPMCGQEYKELASLDQ
jgi:hypothetical protein